MDKSKVVIVGRPNVGKSSLFNRILKKKLAVVANKDGVTRDLHFQDVEWNKRTFQLVDTGGFMHKSPDLIDGLVKQRILIALHEADVIIFVTDGKTSITELDEQFAKIVRKLDVPKILTVNKSESRAVSETAYEFWGLGLGEPMAISAISGMGIYDLMDEVVKKIPQFSKRIKEEDTGIKVAILGRPNAGKSTLVNQILGEDRVMVSPIAGTTRDSIDSKMNYEGTDFTFTDTAGLRKKARVNDEVEYYSNLRTIESIRRSDVCVLLVDSTRGLEVQDLKIAHLVHEAGKGFIICLNKWDLIDLDSKTYDQTVKAINERVKELEWIEKLSISGLSGKRVHRLLENIIEVNQKLGKVLGRDNVIEYFKKTIERHPHHRTNKGAVKMDKCCQVMVTPPALAIQVNRPDLVEPSYIRYLKSQAYQFFELGGVPLRIYFRRNLKLRTDEELIDFVDRNQESSKVEGKVH